MPAAHAVQRTADLTQVTWAIHCSLTGRSHVVSSEVAWWQAEELGEGRCSAAMQATVENVELLAVIADGSPSGLQVALEHIVAVDPASAGVPLQQV